jgi:peptidylprolyl isomerase
MVFYPPNIVKADTMGERGIHQQESEKMKNAATGDTVRVHYTGTLAGGEIFDSSRDREPIEFTLGEGMMIPGFEAAVEGMAEQESKNVRIPAEDAYGERQDELLFTFERESMPEDMNPEPGLMVELRGPGGQAVPARIVEVTADSISVDANHPLSGNDLLFALELVEIVNRKDDVAASND